ncbi:DNA polymerase III subunit gamma/tau [Ideonella sp.]|jgi:DNA polymerase-3 subunit gamma/tau|uniref:DNA polymerase III subunit gamma/tau n=1 Tax=Ideonella sp. TaxID=1929293 RepID=UPI0037BF22DE
MSYVVLARKYRPHSFADMVGQDHVVRALTHALEQQRLHHAYLFTGTRGIGKTTVSRILAKSLNCTGPDGQGGITATPCGVCTACREIDADRYIDYTEMDAASNRSIDEIRELIERAAYKPSVGRFKVFMIDEAHQLTKDAFNALLKTLEEPPEYLKFVLATTDPEKMLPTVLSRCLQFNLRPMAPQTVVEYLGRVLSAEGVPADAGALRLLGRAARGSMRDALSLSDQAIAYGGGKLEEAGVRAMLGSVDRRHAERLIQALAERNGRGVLEQCNALRGQGLSASGTLEEMARLLQQMAVEQMVPGALDATDPDTEAARRLSTVLAPDETQLLYSICLQGRAELSLAPDEYAGLVMVLLRFMAFPPQDGGASGPGPMGAGGGAGHSSATLSGTGGASVASAAAVAAAAPASPAMASPVATPVAAPVAAKAPPAAPAPSPALVDVPRPAAPVVAAPAPVQAAPAAPRAAAPIAAPEPRKGGGDEEPPPWMDDVPPWMDEAEAATSARPAALADRDEPPVWDEPEAAAATEPEPAASSIVIPVVQHTALGERWAAVVAQMTSAGLIAALARELALQAELVAVETVGAEEVWRLKVERESLRTAPLQDKLQVALRTTLSAAEGAPLARLELVAGVAEDSPARREAERQALRQQAADVAIRTDPLVSGVLAQFSTARIVSGSIRPLH